MGGAFGLDRALDRTSTMHRVTWRREKSTENPQGKNGNWASDSDGRKAPLRLEFRLLNLFEMEFRLLLMSFE